MNRPSYTDPFGLCPFTGSDESCYQMLADWGARTGRSWAVNLGAALQAGAETLDAAMGGGCSGGYSCGSPGAFLGPGGLDAEAVNLAKQIASKAQMAERGSIFAGGQSGTVFRNAERYAQQYGGKASDWVKKSSSIYRAKDGARFETHWVENLVTGERVDFKTVFR